jgi:hypothetical protein
MDRKPMKKVIISICAVSAIMAVAWLHTEKPIHISLSSFEQSYLKKVELYIRQHNSTSSDFLFLLTCDEETFYRWRNWDIHKKDQKGGLIFPEKFIINFYDEGGFDIFKLSIPSENLDHREDISASDIILGITQQQSIPYSLAKKAKSLKVSFEYQIK